MLIHVLGSAAGGGFPQWNCNGPQSQAVRQGRPGLRPRTQSSLAVSADGENWVLLNASPDLRQQINATPVLWPRPAGSLRNSPIKAVVLTNADVDHVAGLFTLRERQPFTIYASDRVLSTIASNTIFNILAPDVVERMALPLDTAVPLNGAGATLGLTVTAFPVPGKIALYLEDASAPGYGTAPGDTVGLEILEPATGRRFFYIPGCAAVDAPLAARLRGAPLVFFDGTLYTDSEMIEQGLLDKTGARMGHISISGKEGSIAAFRALGVERKIFIHINNSNPVLDENSAARRETEAAGWEIGFDGMEIAL